MLCSIPQLVLRSSVAMYCLCQHLDAVQRLADIVAALPGLGPSSRVLDVGSGTGCLIPHLQARGVRDILAVDVSSAMVQQLQKLYPAPSSCGNDAGAPTATC
jgi:ubiquinone/menaquinone biosynthesis C-methylase UbiE